MTVAKETKPTNVLGHQLFSCPIHLLVVRGSKNHVEACTRLWTTSFFALDFSSDLKVSSDKKLNVKSLVKKIRVSQKSNPFDPA